MSDPRDDADEDLSADEAMELIVSLETQVHEAIVERCPELEPYLVTPFCVEHGEGDVWMVSRAGEAALFISVESGRCGVGFLDDDGSLHECAWYPDLLLAAQAFGWAVANTARHVSSH
jgi:hypothetical protein